MPIIWVTEGCLGHESISEPLITLNNRKGNIKWQNYYLKMKYIKLSVRSAAAEKCIVFCDRVF